jgi:hypothetical protein
MLITEKEEGIYSQNSTLTILWKTQENWKFYLFICGLINKSTRWNVAHGI